MVLILSVWCCRLVAEICPRDWHRYGDSCYFIIEDNMDWYKVQSKSHLCRVTSKPAHPKLTTRTGLHMGTIPERVCSDTRRSLVWF